MYRRDLLFCGNNKIRNSLFFLSSHGIRAKRENLIFGRSCFIPISFSAVGSPSHRCSSRSRRRPPPSLSSATFREALLRPKTTYFEAHEADLPAGGNPAGNRKHTRRHARLFSGSSPSTRRRVSARVGACLLLRRRDSTHRVVRRRLGLLSLRRSNPSPPYPLLAIFTPP